MKKSFLDYYKEILEKVSFDPKLFSKEYQKAKKYLNQSEVQHFDNWIKEKGLNSSLIRVNSGSSKFP
jgi:hypothetical protein